MLGSQLPRSRPQTSPSERGGWRPVVVQDRDGDARGAPPPALDGPPVLIQNVPAARQQLVPERAFTWGPQKRGPRRRGHHHAPQGWPPDGPLHGRAGPAESATAARPLRPDADAEGRDGVEASRGRLRLAELRQQRRQRTADGGQRAGQPAGRVAWTDKRRVGREPRRSARRDDRRSHERQQHRAGESGEEERVGRAPGVPLGLVRRQGRQRVRLLHPARDAPTVPAERLAWLVVSARTWASLGIRQFEARHYHVSSLVYVLGFTRGINSILVISSSGSIGLGMIRHRAFLGRFIWTEVFHVSFKHDNSGLNI